jgi:hypothetical protein
MNFTKQKYIIVKEAISKDMAEFLYNYFLIKKDAAEYYYKNNIFKENVLLGTWGDTQVSNMYSTYADFAMETLLMKLLKTMRKKTKIHLIPTYSYARVYENGSILKKHKDRASCEVSTTLNLGGNLWPIFLESNNKVIKVNLNPGDMLIYKGCELNHWREKFEGKVCIQVFLHYNNSNGIFKKSNLFDGRAILGISKNI